jgi:hypothetical protein
MGRLLFFQAREPTWATAVDEHGKEKQKEVLRGFQKSEKGRKMLRAMMRANRG